MWYLSHTGVYTMVNMAVHVVVKSKFVLVFNISVVIVRMMGVLSEVQQ